MIINIFNSDNSNVTKIKMQDCQIMTTITDRILKSKPMIKKAIVANLNSLLLLILATSVPFLKSILLYYNFFKAYL